MKKSNLPPQKQVLLFIIFCSLAFSHSLVAQLKLGDNTKNVNPNAILEIESTNRGILIPRLSDEQRAGAFKTSIPNGLLIYNTSENCLQVYKTAQASWECIGSGKLQLINNTLKLDTNSVDLSPYLNESQNLYIEAGETNTSLIALENGNSITLEAGNNITLSESDTTITISAISSKGSRGSSGAKGDPGPSGPQGPTGPPGNAAMQTLMAQPLNNNNILKLGISGDSVKDIDLNELAKDNQTIKTFTVSGVSTYTLTLELERGGTRTLQLPYSLAASSTNTDNQSLSLNGDQLTITNGNTITIPDKQDLSIQTTTSTGTQLAISAGNVVTLQASGGLNFTRSNSSTLVIEVPRVLEYDKGKFNYAIGNNGTLKDNVSGEHNVAMGHDALSKINNSNYNTAIGSLSGNELTNMGDNNTFIGANATASNTLLSNATAIGANAIVTSSNTIQLGDENVTLVKTEGAILLGLNGMLADGNAGFYSRKSESAVAQLIVFDSDSNESIVSPHNFELIGTPSEDMAWSFYSKNSKKGKQINVDMMKMVRLVERLSGEKLIHLADLKGNEIKEKPQIEITKLEKDIELLKKQLKEQQLLIEQLLKKNKSILHQR